MVTAGKSRTPGRKDSSPKAKPPPTDEYSFWSEISEGFGQTKKSREKRQRKITAAGLLAFRAEWMKKNKVTYGWRSAAATKFCVTRQATYKVLPADNPRVAKK